MFSSEVNTQVHRYQGQRIVRTLTDDIAKEAMISSLAYANLAVFVAILFCFAGVSPYAAIAYVVVVKLVLFTTAIIGRLYVVFGGGRLLSACVLPGVVANEVALTSILLFDYFSLERANTLYGIVTMVSISFISVHLCARLTPALLISKVTTIIACMLYLLIRPYQYVAVTEVIASLVVSLLVMVTTGYWIIIRRRYEIALQLQLKDLNQVYDRQNQSLQVALSEKSEVQSQLEEEYDVRQKLVSHIGHDLRQPISAASYMLMELKKKHSGQTEKTLIEDTTECVNSASRMIEEIVQYTHFNNLEVDVLPEWVNLNNLLQQIKREFLSRSHAAGCELRCARTSSLVYLDPELLRRVLRNLTINAIKHSDGTKLLLGVRHRKGSLDIWIADNGQGLNDDLTESSFAYSASSQAGLGLGIKIAGQLATACGAKLSCESRSGEGTVFRLQIPPDLVRRNQPASTSEYLI